jgi:curli biogenesis system outer membrane secretion channel CsgG
MRNRCVMTTAFVVLCAVFAVSTASAQPAAAQQAAPKKRIAVAKFDTIGSFSAEYGTWDIGGGLAAQLTTALIESGQFIIIERAELATVLREQEMAKQGVVSKETASQVGKMLGSQLLIAGAVTEFEQQAGGGGLRLGIGSGIFGGALGGTSTNGIVGMDIRLIDTTTGQVLSSHRAEGKVSQSGVSADVGVKFMTFGGDAFNKTPLGLATRQAIVQGVGLITKSMEKVPWTGRVVEVAGDQVYVNAGTTTGLKAGDVFTVTAVVRELTDPSSGAVLGIVEEKRGDIEVVNVQEKFSVAVMKTPFQTARGDLVKLTGGAR